ncbi:MAG: hypothetical protein U1E36_04585 [Rickettsiales bacterium]
MHITSGLTQKRKNPVMNTQFNVGDAMAKIGTDNADDCPMYRSLALQQPETLNTNKAAKPPTTTIISPWTRWVPGSDHDQADG